MLTKAQVLEGFKSGNMKFDLFDESDIKMRSLEGKEFSGQFRDSRVFVKREGNWQVVLFHSSKIG